MIRQGLKCVLWIAVVYSSFFVLPTSILGEEQVAKVGNIEMWYETFGSPEDPAFLLIMGCGCQGIMWPEDFCKKLEKEGFYVIRFDHRDVGASSSIDYRKTPYTLMDMGKDAVGLLDHLKIEKAHIGGASMGGAIAQLIAAHYPSRVKSLALMATTYDMSVLFDAFEGNPQEPPPLPPPTSAYQKWRVDLYSKHKTTLQEELKDHLEGWRLSNGEGVPFDRSLLQGLLAHSLIRQKDPATPKHHVYAIKSSLQQLKEAPAAIKIPTLIIHGNKDPIFPPDHGRALAKAISGAELYVVLGMGHCVSSEIYTEIVATLKQHTCKQKNP